MGTLMEKLKLLYEGKVREVYDNGDSLIIAATDRISAFDHILKNKVTDKGAILTQMSKFWFDFTKDVINNHMISTDVSDMPEQFQNEDYKGRSMKVKKLTMLPIECIVRGYITGSGWASYKENGTVCGIKLPEGLKESVSERDRREPENVDQDPLYGIAYRTRAHSSLPARRSDKES